jgi:hypothetical protein
MAAIRSLIAPAILERIRAACSGQIVLMKGPEVAAYYPDPVLRPFGDLDVLVEDAPTAQRELLAAGFEPVGRSNSKYAMLHHLQPLTWPGTPLAVEVHRRPEWPKWSAPPPSEELLSLSVPGKLGVDGIAALPASWHAVLLLAHSWSGAPLRRLLDLVDIAALVPLEERPRAAALADRAGLGGVWTVAADAADALLHDGPVPWMLRTWARDLLRVRDSTVLENHLARLLSPFWVLPPRRAARVAATELGGTLWPAAGESWPAKAARASRAARNAFLPLADHDAQPCPDGGRTPPPTG